jgi:hypothetical protein
VFSILPIVIAGTLILVIPTREGVIIAADSLSTVGGIAIPDRTKLHTIPNFNRTVFTITGYSDFFPAPPSNVGTAIWIRTAQPIFSGQDSVRKVLSEAGDIRVSQTLLKLIGESLVRDFQGYFKNKPDSKRQFIGTEICRLLLAQYDAGTGISSIATFVIHMTAAEEVLADQYSIDEIGPNEERYIGKFGEQQYVDAHVLQPGSVGWPHLGPDIVKLWNGPKLVRDMLPQNAAKIASLVIHATEVASRTIPIKTAVGGKPSIMLIDGKSPPRELK